MCGEIHKYLSKIGARGGSSHSKAKRRAVRANGKLGGRPKKKGIADNKSTNPVPLPPESSNGLLGVDGRKTQIRLRRDQRRKIRRTSQPQSL